MRMKEEEKEDEGENLMFDDKRYIPLENLSMITLLVFSRLSYHLHFINKDKKYFLTFNKNFHVSIR